MSNEINVSLFIEANLSQLVAMASDGVLASKAVSGGFALGSKYLSINVEKLREHFGRKLGLHALNCLLASEIAAAYVKHCEEDSDSNALVQTLGGEWLFYLSIA